VSLPWRTGGGPRPSTLPLPPQRMPPWRNRRPLKRWRYVGYFGDAVQVCVARARIGPFGVSWWAVWERETRTLAEATHRRALPYVAEGRAQVVEGPVQVHLHFEEETGVETVSPHGSSYIWTRKQVPPMSGVVVAAGRTHEISGWGVVDDSAGYHARRTSWCWSAGVGELESGERVAWNLVDGVHDLESASERTVWVEGRPHEVGPVRFATELNGVEFSDGGALEFNAEAVRSREENLLVIASSYEQPFGTFSGELPGAGRLRSGGGVMERHDVRW
jgi:hypothetical protein